MGNEPKGHHYVAAFHLAGFTLSGTKDGELFVLDQKQGKQWKNSPLRTARENNFNRVDLEGLDPMGIEKGFSKMEDLSATVIRELVSSKQLPTNEDDFNVLLNFVALTAARVQSVRHLHSERIDKIMDDISRMAFLGTDGDKVLRKLAEAGGETLSDDVVLKIQDCIANKHFTYDMDKNWHIGTTMEAVNVLLPALAKRNWAVWTVADDAPDLVCSDWPVVPIPTQPFPPLLSPNFGTLKTLLTVPLTRRVLLASQFEPFPSDSYIMDSEDVALMNTYRAMYAKQIYSAEKNWTMIANGGVVDGQLLIDGPPCDETEKEKAE